MTVTLALTQEQHSELTTHLITEDGREKVAWALCGRATNGENTRYLIKSIHPVPDEAYVESTRTKVVWKTEAVVDLFAQAESQGLWLLKIHSHPTSSTEFSNADDQSDKEMSSAIEDWMGEAVTLLSCIITPNGYLAGRTVCDKGFGVIDQVMVVGCDISIFERWTDAVPAYARRNAQAFGEGTFRVLKNLRIGIAGCSGTGSQVIEQLARLGVGELVLVDFDLIEEKNLNRITNATIEDAQAQRFKVDVLKQAVEKMGLGTKVSAIPACLNSSKAVKALSVCDVVFGCLDTKSGRHTLNRIAAFYTLPYFDVGVRLDADGRGGIDGIHATVHYVRPGEKSLVHRGVYTMEDVRSENKYLEDPDGYREESSRGYLKGVSVDRPAVIPVNSLASSLAVLELLARIHPYRHSPNSDVDKVVVSITGEILGYESVERSEKDIFAAHVGKGDVIPLLEMPSIT